MRTWVFGFLTVALGTTAIVAYSVAPDVEVVRIVRTTTERVAFNGTRFTSLMPQQAGEATARDVKFIRAVRPNGEPVLFRNEDGKSVWPLYPKFNSFDLQALATELTSDATDPVWVQVTFKKDPEPPAFVAPTVQQAAPNVLSLSRTDSPDGASIVNEMLLALISGVLAMLFLSISLSLGAQKWVRRRAA
ncbi:DUF1523 family protein [Cereibacter johrii]|uniref:DUF1523 family protein n=1 Tax=Cereibacter johrii TaxID=445629 RepID=UPI002B25A0C1|nr:DUF1523 family protein [Cereibacter johrii]MEA5162476.1 DUF1523 family protein [Cereibacter johrii]